MDSLFRNFIEKHTPTNPQMPFTHNTSGANFQSILFNGKISKIMCPVFHQEYVYFFYGRPAYKVSSKEESCTIEELLPVCMLFKPDSLDNVARIYPFDSGAFDQGCYQNVISNKYNIDEFNMGKSLENIQKLISAFYDDNRKYYYGIPKHIKNASCLQIKSYLRLIETLIPLPTDDRKYTVEIILNDEIELKNKILAVILPRLLLEFNFVKDKIKEYDIEYYTYNTVNGFHPDYYNYELFKIVEYILENNKFFEVY